MQVQNIGNINELFINYHFKRIESMLSNHSAEITATWIKYRPSIDYFGKNFELNMRNYICLMSFRLISEEYLTGKALSE
jgi:hypothetical protein